LDLDKDKGNYKYLTIFELFKRYPKSKEVFDNLQFNKDYKFKEYPFHFEVAFIGPKGTLHDFHSDVFGDLLFYQVHGRKLWRVIPTLYDDCLSESEKFDLTTYLSYIRFDEQKEIDEKFPNFRHALVYETILEPGDVLFVPYKAWHYVRSLGPSLSISSFNQSWKHTPRIFLGEAVRYILHKMGLLKNEKCVCCVKKRTWYNWWWYLLTWSN